jgi:PAS domain S-box-containing protein
LSSHSSIMKKTKSNPETDPLRVLILEDNPADAELIQRELQRAGIHFVARQVERKANFKKALAEHQPQIILSDFKLPRFDGLAALKMTRMSAPEVPFIFISGSIGEEKAIEMLSLGACDYIFKDNLARLGPAVRRAIEEARLKMAKKKTDEELRHRVEELKFLAEAAERFVQINDIDEMYKYLSQVTHDISGADYLLLSIYDENLQALRPKIITGFEPFRETLRRRFHIDPREMVFYLKDMRADDFSDFVSRKLLPVRDGLYGLTNRKLPRPTCRAIEKLLAIDAMLTMGFSWENQLFGGLTLSFKKGNELKNQSQIEALLNQAAVAIKRLLAERALRENEGKYRTLVTQSPDGIFIIDMQGNFLSVNQAMCTGLKYSEAEFLAMNIRNIVPESYLDLHKKRLAEIMKGKPQNEAAEYEVRAKDGEIHHIAILSAPYSKDNKLIGFQGIARDITEKKKMENRLRESEEYYRTLVETSPDAIIIVDGGGRVTFASQKTFEIFGIPPQTPILGVSMMSFIEPEEIPRVQGRLAEILSGQSLPQIREYRLLRHDHRPVWGEISSAPLRDAEGRSIGLLLICRDISERKHAEEHIQYQADLLQKVSDAIIATDKDGRIRVWNKAAEMIYGWKAEEALGKIFHDMIKPEYRYQSREEVIEKMGKAGAWSGELVHHLRDGRQIPVQSMITMLKDAAGGPAGTVSVNHDISKRKQTEEQIRSSLREKDVLLQEVHHRVKNNLQIISGLLTLQADHAAGKSIEEIFGESQDRIRSIALIHEKLYRSHNLAEIAFDEYLRSLTENLFSSHGVTAGRITATFDVEAILLTIEKAIPLGLIVNELVTNALIHAFPAGHRGEIRIGLHGRLGGKSFVKNSDSGPLYRVQACELIVADNGVGLPSDQVPELEKTLGMKLVFMLAKQLQAEIKVISETGTEFHLTFQGTPITVDSKHQNHQGGA